MKKIICLVVAVLLVVCILASCQQSTEKPSEIPENVVMGMVTEINGSELTIEQGFAMNNGEEMPEMPDGEQPENMPAMSEGEKPDGEAPEKPDNMDGQNGERPEMPDGELPQNNDGTMNPDEFPSSGETITVDMGSIDISDIEVGDMVTITYGSDGNPSGIEIMEMPEFRDNSEKEAEDETEQE